MAMFINQTGTLGVIYNAVNYNVTGSEFLTLLGLIILCMLFVMIFRMPVEASVILVIPLLIVSMAFNNSLLAIGGAFFIYAGLLLFKNWIVK